MDHALKLKIYDALCWAMIAAAAWGIARFVAYTQEKQAERLEKEADNDRKESSY